MVPDKEAGKLYLPVMEINCFPECIITGPKGAILGFEFVAEYQLVLGTIGKRCDRMGSVWGFYVDQTNVIWHGRNLGEYKSLWMIK